jgi:hypothetical protein
LLIGKPQRRKRTPLSFPQKGKIFTHRVVGLAVRVWRIPERHFDHAIGSPDSPLENDPGTDPAGQSQHDGLQWAAEARIRQTYNRDPIQQQSPRLAQSRFFCRNRHQPFAGPWDHKPVADHSTGVGDDRWLWISLLDERPQHKLDQRLMNPTVQGSDPGIGRLESVDPVEKIWNRKRSDRSQLPEPVIQHYRFGQGTVPTQCAVQGALQPAHRQRGTVPVAIRQNPCDEPDLPPQLEQ